MSSKTGDGEETNCVVGLINTVLAGLFNVIENSVLLVFICLTTVGVGGGWRSGQSDSRDVGIGTVSDGRPRLSEQFQFFIRQVTTMSHHCLLSNTKYPIVIFVHKR